ncbi:MAG: TonB-dependent receptor [Deltaproteobacteria bacterium]|nr:TonB-dependent receptor [Deltaproteobacteria bacterium]
MNFRSLLCFSFFLIGILARAVLAQEEAFDLEDEFAFLEEEDVVVSAAKHKQQAGFAPAAVIIVTRKEIEESGATTLAEFLRRYPQVDVYEFDPLYPTIEIRGTYRTLMLLDGREVNTEMFVSPFYALLPVSLQEIERIEIVMGPNSALYGANAVSAVINVITRRYHDDFNATVSTAFGELGNTIVDAIMAGKAGPVSLQGSFGVERANSWMVRDSLSKDVVRAYATTRIEIPDGELTLNGGLTLVSGRIFGMIGYLETKDMYLAHTMADLKLGDLKLKAYWYGQRLGLDAELLLIHPDLGIELGTIPTIELTADTTQFEAQYDLELFENNLLIVGADFRYSRHHAEQFVRPTSEETRFGAFFHYEHRFFEKLLVTAGLRLDWNRTNKRPTWALSPRGAIVYNLAANHFLRLSGGSAFRKPSIMETSMDFRIDADPAFPELRTLFEEKGISNENLGNETLATVELGYRGSFLDRALKIGLDAYLGFNRNIIGFTTDVLFEDTGLGPRINVDESDIGYTNEGIDYNLTGVSGNFEANPVDQLTLFLRANYSYLWDKETGDEITSYPRIIIATGGTYRLAFGLTAHLAFVYVDRRLSDLRNPYSILGTPLDIKVPERNYLIGSLNYAFKLGASQVDLGLSFFNLFNGHFREEPGVLRTDGQNYGGEILRRRMMLTARFSY